MERLSAYYPGDQKMRAKVRYIEGVKGKCVKITPRSLLPLPLADVLLFLLRPASYPANLLS